MKILFFGDSDKESTSLQRAGALRRLGHDVTVQDPYLRFKKILRHPLLGPVSVRTGCHFLQKPMLRYLKSLEIAPGSFDLVWINGGELFGTKCLKFIRTLGAPVLLYNNDDPTGKRDGRLFDSLRKSLIYYDLCAVRCERDIAEYHALGARRVMHIWMSYDEVAHAPFSDESEIPAKFRSDVAFVGAWMRHENRDEFLLRLADAGIAMAIWGNRWEKSPHWARLRPFYRGKSVAGRDYVAALQGAKICIGLISKGNRDLHTRRSVEVPYAGGLLCAERTVKHEALYQDGEQAVLWSSVEECIEKCQKLLSSPDLREKIKRAGRARVMSLGLGNEAVCRNILQKFQAAPEGAPKTAGCLKILYIGDSSAGSTSHYRACALRRLGNDVTEINPFHIGIPLLNFLNVRTGFRMMSLYYLAWLRGMKLESCGFDVIWIDGGEFFGPRCVRYLRTLNKPIVLFNHDDPTGKRDGRRFDSLKRALNLYDLCVAVRDESVPEYRKLGVTRIIRQWRSYDEVIHAPFAIPAEIPAKFRSEVVFVGAWMRHENRDEFLLKLVKLGVPVAIWGDGWIKSSLWCDLRPHFRGVHLTGREYTAVLQGSKICIGLLCKGNRDRHTTRTMEIPYAGGLLCAERTAEHELLFRDQVEAVFWSSAEECADLCLKLLADESRREKIRVAGMKRVRELGVGNEVNCQSLLNNLMRL